MTTLQLSKRGEDARQILIDSINSAAELVGSTMGPQGRLVVLADHEVVKATKDGHSVLNAILMDDPWEQFGVKLLVDATAHSVKQSGDGTTTTTILTAAMLESALGIYGDRKRSANPNDVVAKLTKEVEEVIAHIEENNQMVDTLEQLYNVAYVSTNGDVEMAKLISQAWWHVGREGVVRYVNGVKRHDEMTVTRGYTMNRGFYSPAFIPSSGKYHNTNVEVVVFNIEVTATHLQGLPQPKDHIVMVAPEYTEEAIHAIKQLRLPVIPVKAPSAGAMQQAYLTDFSVYAGTRPISHLNELEEVGAGQLDEIIITQSETMAIVNNTSADVDEHITMLKDAKIKTADGYDIEAYKTRLAKLTGGIATIYVAGDTTAALEERKHRYDDAILATHSAFKYGYSVGGGYNYLTNASWGKAVIKCLLQATPGLYGEVLEKYNVGEYYDIREDQFVGNYSYQPIDATVTQLTALRTALSVASIVIRANGVLTTQATLMPYNRRS